MWQDQVFAVISIAKEQSRFLVEAYSDAVGLNIDNGGEEWAKIEQIMSTIFLTEPAESFIGKLHEFMANWLSMIDKIISASSESVWRMRVFGVVGAIKYVADTMANRAQEGLGTEIDWGQPAWQEVCRCTNLIYTGDDLLPNLAELVDKWVEMMEKIIQLPYDLPLSIELQATQIISLEPIAMLNVTGAMLGDEPLAGRHNEGIEFTLYVADDDQKPQCLSADKDDLGD